MSAHCPDCGAVASYGHEIGHRSDCPSLRPEPRKSSYQDPTCPKCGIVLGNKMSFACQHLHCPAGLN